MSKLFIRYLLVALAVQKFLRTLPYQWFIIEIAHEYVAHALQ
jgi:hypothetical protein